MSLMEGNQLDLLKQRRLMLFGAVRGSLIERLCSQALFLGGHSKTEPITLIINSPGGSVPDGLALLDCLRCNCSELITVAVGESASMGAVLLAAGTPGHRHVGQNAMVMLHQVRGGAYGSAPDLERQYTELQRCNEHMLDLLATFTGKDREKIRTDIDRDLWLTPQGAVDYGLADFTV